jgi:hypothetical protein
MSFAVIKLSKSIQQPLVNQVFSPTFLKSFAIDKNNALWLTED